MDTFVNNLAEQRIGEIVAQNYHTAGIFQQNGIDFCCGGGITLSKACEKKSKNLADIAQQLTKVLNSPADSSQNFGDWSPSFLIDYIENVHHSFVRTKIEEIGFFATKVARVHEVSHPENIDILDAFTELSIEMKNHMESEEQIVFPLIKKIQHLIDSNQTVPNELLKEFSEQVEQMEDEHEGAGNLMKKIRTLSNDYTPPDDACTTYRILYQNLEGFEQDLHKHVHLENNILFKKAENLLVKFE